jgi:hypothetical protein
VGGKGDGKERVRNHSRVLMAYLTAVFRGRSRQPRPLLVNFEGSAMSWPGPGSPSPGAATLGQRGDISLPGPWDCEAAPTSTLLEAIQIGAIQALFFSFENAMASSLGRFLTRVTTSHIGFFGHVALCGGSHITRCFLFPTPRFRY